MLYPVYVHKGDDTHAHGAELPDFPGCFSAVDNWGDLPSAIQEAVEVYCEGEDMSLPEPSEIDDRDDGGMWIFVDIDLGKLDTRKQRINLSVPANALQEIDEYASAHGQNRSGFMVQASLQVARAS
ncbi:MAG: HicB family protein [Gammaproteobacteria bacterium]|nr:MAG: HicB family protein [Gammaproteobacteria bacterium]RLA42698.1 MAG: HicB family protein [Gammaproteobacteria bacterium]